jgi:hypothetical protein
MGSGEHPSIRKYDELFEKRRKLMEAWAAYCERATGNVVQIWSEKRSDYG